MHFREHAKLIVFSGLPATGKTTVASLLSTFLRATYIRMDAIVLGLKSESHDPEFSEKCYRIARSMTLVNLRLGNTVVTDSINPTHKMREDWTTLAQEANVKSIHIEIICSDKLEHQERVKTRTTTLPGLNDPTWQEIQQIEYQEWKQDRILIDSAHKTIEATAEEVLFAIDSWGSTSHVAKFHQNARQLL